MTPPHVDDYRFGRIVIDGQPYEQDLILFPSHLLTGWWRERGHTLQPGDLEAVLAEPPEVLVVGQGAVGRMAVAGEVKAALSAAGIELIAQWSGKACETYNEISSRRRAALAIHLTC